jgi:hypothetical protein
MTRNAAACLLLLCAAAPAQDEKPANDPKAPLEIRVNQAIDAGVAWLRTKQFPKGNWEDELTFNSSYDGKAGILKGFPTGATSLSLYALLKSGVPADDPAIKKGFQWLKSGFSPAGKGKGAKAPSGRVPGGTYEIATVILALEAKANPHKRDAERERELKFKLKKGEKLKAGVKLEPEDEAWMRDLLGALMARRVKTRGWRYGDFNGTAFSNGPRGDSDLSASQLALLALMAAERCGVKHPELTDATYVELLRWTLTLQEKDGEEVRRWDPSAPGPDKREGTPVDRARGFSYLGAGGDEQERKSTGSMTCCGLANILVCTSLLEARGSVLYTADLQKTAEKAWWDGIAWLDTWWTVERNVNMNNYHYYYLYCLERVGDLKRIQNMAGHAWYNEGALLLVNEQLPSGAWDRTDTPKPSDVLDTAFALLFLNRATPAITGDD